MATPRQKLRKRLTAGPMIVAPGIYDAYGARFVEQAGFEAVYMTGNGVSASLLGRPDVGLIDLTLLSQHAHRAAACVDIPLICDADTGLRQRGQRAAHGRGVRSRGRRGDPSRRPGLAQALRTSAGLAPGGRAGRGRSARSKRPSPRAAIPISSSSRAPTAASGHRARRSDPPRQGFSQGRRGRGVRRAEEQPAASWRS